MVLQGPARPDHDDVWRAVVSTPPPAPYLFHGSLSEGHIPAPTRTACAPTSPLACGRRPLQTLLNVGEPGRRTTADGGFAAARSRSRSLGEGVSPNRAAPGVGPSVGPICSAADVRVAEPAKAGQHLRGRWPLFELSLPSPRSGRAAWRRRVRSSRRELDHFLHVAWIALKAWGIGRALAPRGALVRSARIAQPRRVDDVHNEQYIRCCGTALLGQKRYAECPPSPALLLARAYRGNEEREVDHRDPNGNKWRTFPQEAASDRLVGAGATRADGATRWPESRPVAQGAGVPPNRRSNGGRPMMRMRTPASTGEQPAIIGPRPNTTARADREGPMGQRVGWRSSGSPVQRRVAVKIIKLGNGHEACDRALRGGSASATSRRWTHPPSRRVLDAGRPKTGPSVLRDGVHQVRPDRLVLRPGTAWGTRARASSSSRSCARPDPARQQGGSTRSSCNIATIKPFRTLLVDTARRRPGPQGDRLRSAPRRRTAKS